jgi:hydroxymethylpyrimidine pyrophosphatase-like HAD family hydrolase
MEKLGIKANEIVAIGDNLNDKEMIENAGLGVVMGNSNPKMKEMANVIVADNDSEGVMDAINKFVLI